MALDPNCFAPGFEDKMQEFMDEIRGMDPVSLHKHTHTHNL